MIYHRDHRGHGGISGGWKNYYHEAHEEHEEIWGLVVASRKGFAYKELARHSAWQLTHQLFVSFVRFVVKPNLKTLCALCVLCGELTSSTAFAYPGLPTRDQNPLLVSYFIPTHFSSNEEGLSLSHNLSITNTLHKDSAGSEVLRIDGESRRFDLNLAYRSSDWVVAAKLPFIDHGPGQLDGLIEGWHDVFHLPEGGRDTNPDDQFLIRYQVDGDTVFSTIKPTSGLGDIQLTIGRDWQSNDTSRSGLWFALDLPTTDENAALAGDSVESAFWFSYEQTLSDKLQVYGLAGLSLLDDKGPLTEHVRDTLFFAQAGLGHRLWGNSRLLLQVDAHQSLLENTNVRVLGHSLQMQFGLEFNRLPGDSQLMLLFSEDVYVESAPDITFGLQWRFSLD